MVGGCDERISLTVSDEGDLLLKILLKARVYADDDGVLKLP
jgi:hypothetical protein